MVFARYGIILFLLNILEQRQHNAILAVHPVLLLFVFICALNLI